MAVHSPNAQPAAIHNTTPPQAHGLQRCQGELSPGIRNGPAVAAAPETCSAGVPSSTGRAALPQSTEPTCEQKGVHRISPVALEWRRSRGRQDQKIRERIQTTIGNRGQMEEDRAQLTEGVEDQGQRHRAEDRGQRHRAQGHTANGSAAEDKGQRSEDKRQPMAHAMHAGPQTRCLRHVAAAKHPREPEHSDHSHGPPGALSDARWSSGQPRPQQPTHAAPRRPTHRSTACRAPSSVPTNSARGRGPSEAPPAARARAMDTAVPARAPSRAAPAQETTRSTASAARASRSPIRRRAAARMTWHRPGVRCGTVQAARLMRTSANSSLIAAKLHGACSAYRRGLIISSMLPRRPPGRKYRMHMAHLSSREGRRRGERR